MISACLSFKEISISIINESLKAHFHLYITNKRWNEVECDINSLDSSDGGAIGYEPLG